MILYIGWTNLMLLNIHRIQTTINKDKDAILIVIDNGVMNAGIIESIRESDSFYDIVIIPVVWFNTSLKSVIKEIRRLPKILYYSKHIKNYYGLIISKNIAGFDFKEVFVPGFGYNILLILEVLSIYNSLGRIKFYESGTTQYANSLEEMMQDLEHGTRSEKLIRKFNEFFLRKKFKIKVDNELFVYEPKCIKERQNIKAIQIPKFRPKIQLEGSQIDSFTTDEKSNVPNEPIKKYQLIDTLFNAVPETVLIALRKRNILFLASYGASLEEELRLFVTLFKEENNQNIYLKVHSQAPSVHKKIQEKFGKFYFTDTNNYLLEAVFNELDLSNKIIISRYSAAGLNPKFMFGQEPVIIFIYKLFAAYEFVMEDPFGELIKRLREQYSDPNRILVPTTRLEFTIMLHKAKLMVNEVHFTQQEMDDIEAVFVEQLTSQPQESIQSEKFQTQDLILSTEPNEEQTESMPKNQQNNIIDNAVIQSIFESDENGNAISSIDSNPVQTSDPK